jgi:beta-galactosidase
MPLVAILRGLAPADAPAIGAALFDAGFRLLEVPLNRPGALEAIGILAALAPPGALVGGGTMLSVDQVDAVYAAGGRLLVAPNCDTAVIRRGRSKGAAFWRGHFDTGRTADTFLDMSGWGQGIVWVNGRCLGRYWSIGPTQTMYLPGPWVRKGRNEVVVLDLTGPREARIAGVATPILDQLHRERDLPRPPSTATVRLDGVAPVHEGEFAPGSATQDVRFAAPAHGRQFCLESLDAFDGKQFAAVAELALLGKDGKTIEQSSWTIAYVSSEEATKEDGGALNAINGQNSDYWLTASGTATHPHRLVIDLGKPVEVAGLRYTPRQGPDGVTGRIRRFKVYVGDRLVIDY